MRGIAYNITGRAACQFTNLIALPKSLKEH